MFTVYSMDYLIKKIKFMVRISFLIFPQNKYFFNFHVLLIRFWFYAKIDILPMNNY